MAMLVITRWYMYAIMAKNRSKLTRRLRLCCGYSMAAASCWSQRRLEPEIPGSSCGWKNTDLWYLKWKICQPDIDKNTCFFFWYVCPLNQPSDMFINVLLQDVRHPKVRYTPKLNIESFFHGVWKRTAILVIATNICVTSMPYCWLYIPSHFSSIERINPYFRYWYIYIYMIYIYISL